MTVSGLLVWALARRIPIALTHFVLAATAAAASLLVYESGVAVGQYGTIFVWATLMAAYFFPRRVAAAHVAWILVVYGVTLAMVESTAGYSPLTRWLFTAISLSVVAALTTALVARRNHVDMRARRFFDLSRDMLCTFDRDGNAVELNSSWEDSLGYSAEELRAAEPFEFLHPDERARSEQAVASLFDGFKGGGFENRYRAKDGSWRWLSWSAALAPDESLIYARATDVTELKQVESEREELLEEVEELAHSDALTGLPNRRAPRCPAAARDGPRPAHRVAAVPGDHRHRPLQDLQRHPRPPGRRHGPARLRGRLGLGAARRRHDRPLRRRGVPDPPARLPARPGRRDRRAPARGHPGRADLLGRPRRPGTSARAATT